MFKKSAITVVLTLSILISSLIIGVTPVYAHDYYYGPYYRQPYYHHPSAGHKAIKALEYGAFGAGAGYVLSGRHHRGTNILKGAAIGTAASFLTGR